MLSGSRDADLYIHSDARLAVEALDKLLADRGVKSVGYRTPDVKNTLANLRPDPAEFPIDAGTVDPREACELIDDMLPSEIGLYSGGGMSSGFTTMHTRKRRTINAGGHFFGCIGQGLPAAMGAIVAMGNKPVTLIDGDACFMMHLVEFETAVRYKMPLLVVVLNNEALGAEYYKLEAKNLDPETSTIPTPDLGAVGVSMGGRGRLARSIDELRSAVAEYVAKPGPMIIDLRISRSVLSVPYRRMCYGRDD
jgi:thiamine pyrophosphate-dependent acetolactate synthase large subunit-like protein